MPTSLAILPKSGTTPIISCADRHCMTAAHAGPQSGFGGQSSGQQGVAATACNADACAAAGLSAAEIIIPPSTIRTNTVCRIPRMDPVLHTVSSWLQYTSV